MTIEMYAMLVLFAVSMLTIAMVYFTTYQDNEKLRQLLEIQNSQILNEMRAFVDKQATLNAHVHERMEAQSEALEASAKCVEVIVKAIKDIYATIEKISASNQDRQSSGRASKKL